MDGMLVVLEVLGLGPSVKFLPQFCVLDLELLVELDLSQLLLELGPLDLAQLVGVEVIDCLILLIDRRDIVGPGPPLAVPPCLTSLLAFERPFPARPMTGGTFSRRPCRVGAQRYAQGHR